MPNTVLEIQFRCLGKLKLIVADNGQFMINEGMTNPETDYNSFSGSGAFEFIQGEVSLFGKNLPDYEKHIINNMLDEDTRRLDAVGLFMSGADDGLPKFSVSFYYEGYQ